VVLAYSQKIIFEVGCNKAIVFHFICFPKLLFHKNKLMMQMVAKRNVILNAKISFPGLSKCPEMHFSGTPTLKVSPASK